MFMDLKYLTSKKVAILGMGIEGIALAKYLIGKTASITLLDRRSKEELIRECADGTINELFDRADYLNIFGENYLDNLDQYDVIFRTPGIKYLLPEIQKAKEKGVEISSQIKLFFDLCPAKIIGVTGTKGKGTTASLIYEMLKEKYKVYLAGNIGLPAVSLLDGIKSEDVVILELSSFQLQDLHTSPHIAVITNLEQDHLDYHQNLEEYIEAKKNIFIYQKKSDYLILNDKIDSSYYSGAKAHIKKVSLSKNSSSEAVISLTDRYFGEVFLNGDKEKLKICDSKEISLVGIHNLENIASASLVADTMEVDIEKIRDAAKRFKGLPHRLEYVANKKGIEIYNDSFATNPEPTIAAINSFPQVKVLILGGSSKNADFGKLANVVAQNNIKKVILIGNEAERINNFFQDADYKGEIVFSGNDLNQAINDAISTPEPGSVLLFSPACASFDMFKNYKERGEKFKEIVHSI